MEYAPGRCLSFGYGVIRTLRNAGLVVIATFGLASAEPVTVAALGDSLTQGYGLAPMDGFVPQLERYLGDQGVVAKFINAGVSGDTSAGGLSRIDWTLTEDVDALIVALGGNDLLRGMDPKASRENLSGILEVAKNRAVPVLLIGMEAPSNYGADYKASFDAIYPELAAEYSALFHPNFLGALLSQEDRAETVATFMQPDGIHPNAEGVALIVEDLAPKVIALIKNAAER